MYRVRPRTSLISLSRRIAPVLAWRRIAVLAIVASLSSEVSISLGREGERAAPAANGVDSVSLLASRTGGVAPLAVFFNATGTTSLVTAHPFHEIEYRWDFGDPNGGSWANGSRAGSSSRNSATGPVAGHVFESPGTYTVTLTTVDGVQVLSRTVQIIVGDPDRLFAGTKTVCIGAGNRPAAGSGGCPSGAATVATNDFHSALSQNAGTGKRLLFRRGDTFSASTSSSISATGPGLIGAFGVGAKPIVNATANLDTQGIINFGAQNLPNSSANLKDWRVMDISFNGGGTSEILAHGGGFDQLTYLRVDATRCGDACFMFNGDLLAYYNGNGHGVHHVWTDVAIADCSLSKPGNWSLYLWAKNFSLLGNSFDNQGAGSHTVRIIAGINGAISNNLIARNGTSSPAGNHVLKFHAPDFSGTPLFAGGTYSENVVISDNQFIPSNARVNNWTIAIDPQDSSENERLRNIIFERNWLTAGTNTSIGVAIQAVGVTVRNNLYDGSHASAATFAAVTQRSSGAPPPNDIWIYNNTMYSLSDNVQPSTPFITIGSSVPSSGVTIRNNLGYASSALGPALVSKTATAIASNNSTNAQVNTNPGFASASPSTPSDFIPKSGSYARNSGVPVPVFSDFFRANISRGQVNLGFAASP